MDDHSSWDRHDQHVRPVHGSGSDLGSADGNCYRDQSGEHDRVGFVHSNPDAEDKSDDHLGNAGGHYLRHGTECDAA